MAEQGTSWWRRLVSRVGFERDWYLVIVAAAVGVLMGAVAMAYLWPLQAIEHWMSSTTGSAPSRWLMYLLVAVGPAAGGLLTGVVIHYVRGTAMGPGVSTVMYAVHRSGARLPLRTAARKWLASTLTIGSGGSAGAEGPIVTIGSTVGSNLGQWLRLSPQNTATLLGCGAAAGIASVFHAPIAGIFFVMEILLRDFSLRTFTPIVIASVISATWTQTMMGDSPPLFGVGPEFFTERDLFTMVELPNFLVLGILCGVVAPLFVRALFWSDGVFARIKVHPIFKPAMGGAILGVLGVVWLTVLPDEGFPKFFGNGYPVIRTFLDPATYFNGDTGMLNAVAALVVLAIAIGALKVVGTCLTIGSGGAGGLFAPSLLIGATAGGAFGMLVVSGDLLSATSPAHYALVGMAAMVAATTHAPLTGIIIVYEITKSEEIVLPLMFAAVISVIVARAISTDSVYTWKLSRMGLRVGSMSDHTILRRLFVQDVPLADAIVVRQDDSAQRLLDLSAVHPVLDFVVHDADGRYTGMVVAADLRVAMLEREAVPLLLVSELERADLPTVTLNDPLDIVLDRFSRHDVHSLAVLSNDDTGRVLGLITRDRLMRRYREALDEE